MILQLRIRVPTPGTALAVGLLCATMVLLSRFLEIPEERIHLVEYAVLGALLVRSFQQLRVRRIMPWTLLICMVVAGLDEGFQWILPWRVGDIRDVAIDTAGGLWGAISMRILLDYWNDATRDL